VTTLKREKNTTTMSTDFAALSRVLEKEKPVEAAATKGIHVETPTNMAAALDRI
jgi:hypothetical protein